MVNGPTYNPIMPIYPEFDQQEAVEEGYVSNADVYSIIHRKAVMASSIPLYVYRVKGKEGKKWLREYKTLTSGTKFTRESMLNAQLIKIKAMEEVEEDHPLNKLLLRPNDTDSQSEFLEKCYGFLDITGNAYIFKDKPEMGANAGVTKRLTTLPSPYMEIVPDGVVPNLGIAGYIFNLYGNMSIMKDEIIHLKYFNPDYQPDGSQLYGMAPLRAGRKTLTRSNSEADSVTAQFQHGGPAGIAFNKSIPNDPTMTQVGALKKKWEQETWGNKNRGKILFSAGDMGYLQMGLSPADLQILESEKITFRKLCRIFNMPSAIFNDNEHATLNNMEQFYRAAYTDGAIPLVIKLRDALNTFLLPEFGDNGEYFIDADYSNIPVLQEDMKTLCEWLDKSPEITLNERREMKKFGRLPDPNMDKVYVPSSWVPLEDLNMPLADSIDQDVEDLNKAGLMPYK